MGFKTISKNIGSMLPNVAGLALCASAGHDCWFGAAAWRIPPAGEMTPAYCTGWLVHFGRVLESGLTASAQDALNGLNVGFDDLRLLTQ